MTRAPGALPLGVVVLLAALVSLGIAALGWLVGVVVGFALALLMLGFRIAERAVLPFVISQTVPLTATSSVPSRSTPTVTRTKSPPGREREPFAASAESDAARNGVPAATRMPAAASCTSAERSLSTGTQRLMPSAGATGTPRARRASPRARCRV